MNRKQFTILIVLLVVLGGAGWLVQQARNRAAGAGEVGAGRKLLGEKFPVNDVASISIKQGTNELNLVKKDDVWRVRERADYPASFSDISGFLLKAADLKIIQDEEIGASQLPRLQLAAEQGTNSATVVDLKNKDGKPLVVLTLGKKHIGKMAQAQSPFGGGEIPDGRYVMVSGNEKQALLIADPLSNVEPTPETWLDKDFFKIERPKTVAVTFTNATNSWKIVREGDSADWQLANPKGDEKLDAARASGVSSPFSSASFTDVLLNSKPEANGLDKPTVITVDTFDDFTYTVKIGTKSGDNYPVTMTVVANFPKTHIPAKDEKPEDALKAEKAWKDREKQLEDKLQQAKKFENWTYLVSSWSVDPLLKNRKDLLVEKKDEKKTDAASTEKAADDSGLPNPEQILSKAAK